MHAWRMRPVRRRADDDNNWNREEVNLKLLLCTPGTRHGAGSPKARRVHPRCSPCRGTPLLVAALPLGHTVRPNDDQLHKAVFSSAPPQSGHAR